jgi:hypothetical protein
MSENTGILCCSICHIGHVISSEIFNGTLTISSVTKADTGTYRCSVESIPGIFTLSTNSLVKVIGQLVHHSITHYIIYFS